MYHQYNPGYLEVITGCMFAGKTEELIRRIHTLQFAKRKVVVFKPALDTRYSEDKIVSHNGKSIPSFAINKALEIYDYIDDQTDVVAIDEVQFFDEDILLVCEDLALKGLRVMVAGLDMNFKGESFGVIPTLLTQAEFVTKLTAVCTVCGSPATRTQRLVNGKAASYYDPVILLGASESYEARCRHHHEVKDKPKIQKELR